MSRTTKPIQTPGGEPAGSATQTPDTEASSNAAAEQGGDSQAVTSAVVPQAAAVAPTGEDLHERIRQLEAENQRLAQAAAVAKKAEQAPQRASTATMRADQIDPDEITAPVLTADGWVIPTPKADFTRK